MSLLTSDTIPINWHPEWPGYCPKCMTEQVKIVASFDDDFYIAAWELWAECSLCGEQYTLPVPYTKRFEQPEETNDQDI